MRSTSWLSNIQRPVHWNMIMRSWPVGPDRMCISHSTKQYGILGWNAKPLVFCALWFDSCGATVIWSGRALSCEVSCRCHFIPDDIGISRGKLTSNWYELNWMGYRHTTSMYGTRLIISSTSTLHLSHPDCKRYHTVSYLSLLLIPLTPQQQMWTPQTGTSPPSPHRSTKLTTPSTRFILSSISLSHSFLIWREWWRWGEARRVGRLWLLVCQQGPTGLGGMEKHPDNRRKMRKQTCRKRKGRKTERTVDLLCEIPKSSGLWSSVPNTHGRCVSSIWFDSYPTEYGTVDSDINSDIPTPFAPGQSNGTKLSAQTPWSLRKLPFFSLSPTSTLLPG